VDVFFVINVALAPVSSRKKNFETGRH
jgi:hypothetical protein